MPPPPCPPTLRSLVQPLLCVQMTAGTYFDIVYQNNTTEMPRLKNFSVPYLAIFEQGGSADVFSLITGGQR